MKIRNNFLDAQHYTWRLQRSLYTCADTGPRKFHHRTYRTDDSFHVILVRRMMFDDGDEAARPRVHSTCTLCMISRHHGSSPPMAKEHRESTKLPVGKNTHRIADNREAHRYPGTVSTRIVNHFQVSNGRKTTQNLQKDSFPDSISACHKQWPNTSIHVQW